MANTERRADRMRTKLESIAILFATVLSAVSLTISILSYSRGTESEQVERRQNEAMRVVAAHAVLLWRHVQNVSVAYRAKVEVEPLIYTDIQKKASKLDDAIQAAIALGVYEDLLSSRSCAVNQFASFSKFIAYIQSLDPKSTPPEAWGREEFVFGLNQITRQGKAVQSTVVAGYSLGADKPRRQTRCWIAWDEACSS